MTLACREESVPELSALEYALTKNDYRARMNGCGTATQILCNVHLQKEGEGWVVIVTFAAEALCDSITELPIVSGNLCRMNRCKIGL
jgi:hypothetical protein